MCYYYVVLPVCCRYRIAQKFDKFDKHSQNFDELLVGFKGESLREED